MLINPIIEHRILTQWLGTLVGKPITPRKFVHRLSIFLNRRHPITVHFEFNNSILFTNDFTVGGIYDVVRDECNLKPLVFFFIINHPIDELWIIDNKIADELALELIEALVHEYQHLHQYRSRDYILNRGYKSFAKDSAIKENQEYLGQADEIDAYATNIAVKFYLSNHQLSQSAHRPSLDLENYYKTFGAFHPVVKKLLKKIIKKLWILEEHRNHCNLIETKF